MIGSKKIYASILILSLISASTHSSYAYFTDQSIKEDNVISIAELDSEEGALEIVNAMVDGNILKLEFSKRIFFTTENILEGISGDKYILENSKIRLDKNCMYIEKVNGNWVLPDSKKEKNLPKISLVNFEDRFGKKINAQDIYFYQSIDYSETGKLEYIIEGKDVKTDLEILASSVDGVEAVPGLGATTIIEVKNSEEDIVTIDVEVKSKKGLEELSNNKKIKVISNYGTQAYSEWVEDTLEIYLCYGQEYTEGELQEIIDNVVNIDSYKKGIHEFDIEKINVKFANPDSKVKPTVDMEEAIGTLSNAINTTLGKKTRGSLALNSNPTITGRFRIKITDIVGLEFEDVFLAIKGESLQDIMTKVVSNIDINSLKERYMINLKDSNTRLDLTTVEDVNTGLKIEVEKL